MRIYLDSSILLSSIADKSKERTKSKSIIETLRTHDVVIPQIVIAEIFSKVLTYKDNIYLKLQDISNNILSIIEPNSCIPNANKEVYELAIDIINNDNRIDICDAIIVAQSILDNNADMLLTFDTKILKSNYIIDVLIQQYNNRLEIKDHFP